MMDEKYYKLNFIKDYMDKRGILKKDKFLKNYKGQIWVETVIYLLIAFVMMGLVLSFIRPKIEELRDKAIIEQSLEIVKNIDNLIINIGSSGNVRIIEIGIRKGSLIIDSINDTIIFEMDSRYIPSEPGKIIQIGNIEEITEQIGQINKVTLQRNFSGEYNFTYKNGETLKTLSKTSIPYKLSFTNKGKDLLDRIVINFDIE